MDPEWRRKLFDRFKELQDYSSEPLELIETKPDHFRIRMTHSIAGEMWLSFALDWTHMWEWIDGFVEGCRCSTEITAELNRS